MCEAMYATTYAYGAEWPTHTGQRVTACDNVIHYGTTDMRGVCVPGLNVYATHTTGW